MPFAWKVGVCVFAVSVGAVCGPLIQQWLANRQPAQPVSYPIQTAVAPAPPRSHNYDLKDGVDYGYTVLVTDEQRKFGKEGAEIIMFSYAGERDGKHQVHHRQAGIITAYECSTPCDIVKVLSAMDIDGLRKTVNVERLRSSPNMIAAMALQDAMTGKLQTYSEYPEAAPKGTRLDVWLDDRKGITRTIRK